MALTVVDSPIGPLGLVARGPRLTALDLGPGDLDLADQAGEREERAVLAAAREQLAAYFDGSLRDFDLPLDAAGTPFQGAVWRALLEISYGTTVSYGELARTVGRPGSARAVGAANGSNPIAIVIPCHRVIGAGGSLTGYGGGLPRKAWLLAHEAAHAGGQLTLTAAATAPA